MYWAIVAQSTDNSVGLESDNCGLLNEFALRFSIDSATQLILLTIFYIIQFVLT